MRGRIPTPTAVKATRGSRIRTKSELKAPAGRPKPKAFLSSDGRKFFKQLCNELEGMKILSVSDGITISVLADLWATYSDLKQQISDNPNDPGLRRLASSTANQILQFSREFGLTPSARTRLKQIGTDSKSESDDVWAELAREDSNSVMETQLQHL